MSFTLIKPVAGGRSTISGLQLRTLRLTRPDVNERLARAARNPITFRSMLRSGSVAQIKGLQLEPPGEFVPNSDILLYVPQEGDYEWFHSLTPRYLQRSAREEIVGYLYLELVERRVDRAGLRETHNRRLQQRKSHEGIRRYSDPAASRRTSPSRRDHVTRRDCFGGPLVVDSTAGATTCVCDGSGLGRTR